MAHVQADQGMMLTLNNLGAMPVSCGIPKAGGVGARKKIEQSTRKGMLLACSLGEVNQYAWSIASVFVSLKLPIRTCTPKMQEP